MGDTTNLPNINWTTGTATTNDTIYDCSTNLIHDDYLRQLVDFPTRNENVLDLILSNAPEKVKEFHGFEDIISTDHKLISFTLDFNIPKKIKSSAMSLTTKELTGTLLTRLSFKFLGT